MSVEIRVDCDKCNCDITDGDDCFCKDCYDEMEEKAEEGNTEAKLKELKGRVDEIIIQLQKLF